MNYQIFTGGEDDKWEGGEDGGEGSRDPERRGLGRAGEVRETRGTPGEMESNRTTISRPLARSKGWKWLIFFMFFVHFQNPGAVAFFTSGGEHLCQSDI